ncbi:MAG: putative Ig domain-containing protein [Planctomycetota bacterium]|jgi:hypothetical protein
MRSIHTWVVLCLAFSVLLYGCPGESETITNNYVTPIPVQIETTYVPDATEGAPYSVSLVASGGEGNYNWSIQPGGTNDTWLSIDAVGTISASTPPGQADVGDVILLVKVEDGSNPTNFDVQTYFFQVLADPTIVRITTSTLMDGWIGWAYSESLSAEGGSGNYTWQKLAGGTNDTWVSVNTAGTLSGFPSAGAEGPVTLNVRVFDSQDATKTDSATFQFDVYKGTLSITTPDPLPGAALSSTYSVTVLASGGSGNYRWEIAPGGSNNGWLSIGATDGVLGGTVPGTASTTTVNITATDQSNPSIFAQKSFTISLKALVISTETLDDAFVGIAYTQALAYQGGSGTVTFTIEPGGSNYSWLSISGPNIQNPSGPAAGDRGAVTVIVKADDGSNSDVRAFNLTVWDPVQVVQTLPDANVGLGYSEIVRTSGGTGNHTYSIIGPGTNDGWLSIDSSTGRLTGTPTSAELGPVAVTVRVVERDTPTVMDQKAISFTVQGLVISNASLPHGEVGQAYQVTLTATGGSGYLAWSAPGAPAWLTLTPDSGVLSGTPSLGDAGLVTLNIQVYDPFDALLTDTRTYAFLVVNTILKEEFDAGTPAGWTATGDWRHGAKSTTRVGPFAAHSGSSFYGPTLTGLYWNNRTWGTSMLTSPVLSLAGTTNPVVVFYQWYQTAPNDGGMMEISVNGLTGPWVPINPLDISPTYNGTVGGFPGFTGFGVVGSGWERVVVDLQSIAGQTNVALRWSFYSDNDGVQNPGWYVDSLHIFDRPASAAPIEASNPTPSDGIVYAPPQASDFTGGISLSWDAAIGTGSYDVYLGTSQSAVATANNASAEFMGNQIGIGNTIYTATALTPGNTYYWRIDPIGAATTTGQVWSFTTSNPVQIFVNEIQLANFTGYGPYVELYNPSTSVYQDITGWDLNTTHNGAGLQTFAIPSRVILSPQAARAFVGANFTTQSFANYRAWDTISMPFNLTWSAGNQEGEAWIRDPGGNGVDYLGWNVNTSNRPGDLNWSGSLTQTSSIYTIWRRTSNTDTDTASDFRSDYRTYYGVNWGFMGEKDAGQ